MRYSGTRTNANRRHKYEGCHRTKVEGVMVRRLTKTEIREWRLRLQRIIDPDSVTVLVPVRRAVV